MNNKRYLIVAAWVLSILLSVGMGMYLGRLQMVRLGQEEYETTYRKCVAGARAPIEVIQASRDLLALERTIAWDQNTPFINYADRLAQLLAHNHKLLIVSNHGTEHFQSHEKLILEELDEALETLRHRDEPDYAKQVMGRVEKTLDEGLPPLFQSEPTANP